MTKSIKINESFVCIGCGKAVPLAPKTCRNHCPWCFTSVHVDATIPGDRAADCWGKMLPIAYEIKNAEYRILFSCQICGKQHRNKRAEDDEITLLPALIQKTAPLHEQKRAVQQQKKPWKSSLLWRGEKDIIS